MPQELERCDAGFRYGLCENLGRVLVRSDHIGKLLHGHQQVFLAHDETRCIQAREFETVTVSDGVGRAGFDTVAAEDAAVVIDVVDLGVTLGRGDALFRSVLCGFDVNAVLRTGRRAEEAGDALLEALLVALKLMLAAEALLKLRPAHWPFAVRIVLDLSWLKGLLQRDAHSLGDGGGVANDGHVLSIA